MDELGIGLIGTGFMGRAHALAFHNASAVFELPLKLRLVALADADAQRAESCAQAWGFEQAHGDWQQLIDDPKVDVVAITTPNHLHFPMAMAALAAGKAVYCEKPLAVDLDQATQMRDAARQAGVVTRVGYNYQHNPMIDLARELIQSGELGEIVGFQGEFSEDFMADPASPWSTLAAICWPWPAICSAISPPCVPTPAPSMDSARPVPAAWRPARLPSTTRSTPCCVSPMAPGARSAAAGSSTATRTT